MNSNRLLMIDDDNDTISLYAIIANKLGFGEFFTAAQSGYDALNYLEKCKNFPDVILVDINMDGMNGFQFVAKFEMLFYELHPDTNVIVLSSSVRESDKMKALNFDSVIEFISKPLMKDKLKELMSSPPEYHHEGN